MPKLDVLPEPIVEAKPVVIKAKRHDLKELCRPQIHIYCTFS
jgi:hypothetical protein